MVSDRTPADGADDGGGPEQAAGVGLDADTVATAEFPTSFRGYDQMAVRTFLADVGDELRRLRSRVGELEARVAEVEAEAAQVAPAVETEPPAPELTSLGEDELTALVGAETARVLTAARTAASEIRSTAEAEAERVVTEAHERAEAETAAAEERARAMTAEAESLLEERRATAGSIVGEIEEDARRRADAEVAAARDRGREMVAEAQAVRERILRDLARRRRLAHQQLEQARAGRDRLLEAYRVVQRTMEEAVRALEHAEQEARAAGERAALRAGSEPEPSVAELEAEVAAGRHVGTAGGEQPAGADAGTHDDGTDEGGEPTVDEPSEGGATADQPADGGASDGEAGDGGPGDGERPATPLGPVTGPVGDPVAGEEEPPPEPVSEPVGAEAPGEEGWPVAGEEEAAAERQDDEPVGHEAPVGGEGASAHEEPPGGESTDEPAVGNSGSHGPGDEPGFPPRFRRRGQAGPDEPGAPGGATAVADIDALFARLRAGQEAEPGGTETDGIEDDGIEEAGTEDAGTEDAQAVAAEPVDVAEPAGPDETAEANEADETAEADEADGPAEADEGEVVRPEQGGGVRRRDFEREVPLTPADEAELDRRDAAVEPLERALASALKRALADDQNEVLAALGDARPGDGDRGDHPLGADAELERFRAAAVEVLGAAVDAGWASRRDDERPDDRVPVDDLARTLARSVVGALRERVEATLAESATVDDAHESIAACYREWRTQRIPELARDHVTTAFSRGAYAALPESARVRWIVDCEHGPCPDGDDNALAGWLTRGEVFPTGHRYPPAHAGCRCMLVPDSI